MSDNQQFCLRWNNHQSTLVQVIDSLLSSGVLVDCTLAAEGKFLHAHKVVLCACSPYLETLLSQHYEKHPIVILKDVKFQELQSMIDYMYKGEVNISQDQLAQFLKAAESLQIKGLTDGGGENETRDVGSTSQKRHESAPVRKSVPINQSRSPLVLPPHTNGLSIEPSKRSLPPHLSDSQPVSPNRSREGSMSPTRKRRRSRRSSQGDDDGHQDNSCDLPLQPQTMSITSVPTSIPSLPSGSSSTIAKNLPPDDDSQTSESDRLSGMPAEGFIKAKVEPQSEMLIEPKTEYMDETNNDDSVEDLTLDDDEDYENYEGGPGPSHGGNNSNDNYAAWQQMTGDRQDDSYLNPTDAVHRDSQGDCVTLNLTECDSRGESSVSELTVLPETQCDDDGYADENALSDADSFDLSIDLPPNEDLYTIPVLPEPESASVSPTVTSGDGADPASAAAAAVEFVAKKKSPSPGVSKDCAADRPPQHVLRKVKAKRLCSCPLETNAKRSSPLKRAGLRPMQANSATTMARGDGDAALHGEIGDEILKRFNLKNFSIMLSDSLCNEYRKQQEKLNFLYYFNVVERDTLEGREKIVVKRLRKNRSLVSNKRCSLTSTVPAKKVKSLNGNGAFRMADKPLRKTKPNLGRRRSGEFIDARTHGTQVSDEGQQA